MSSLKELGAKIRSAVGMKASKDEFVVKDVVKELTDWKSDTEVKLEDLSLKRLVVLCKKINKEKVLFYLVRGKKTMFKISEKNFDNKAYKQSSKVDLSKEIDCTMMMSLIKEAKQKYLLTLAKVLKELEEQC
jgi:hypothetical protein